MYLSMTFFQGDFAQGQRVRRPLRIRIGTFASGQHG